MGNATGNATGSRRKYVRPDKKWKDYDALPSAVKARLQIAQSNWLCHHLAKQAKAKRTESELLAIVEFYDDYHLKRSRASTRHFYGATHPQA